mmetsp:Transcript_25775/g.50487  ORF Transcript_25775/g.50487 Transcript_25775/m.50487 type:complete len:212 (+) Transcript_25775:277-912(+)
MITEKGTTSNATCVDEPTEMPIARPGLSFMAKRTALACSHALPAMGSRITAMKDSGMPALSTTLSSTSTRACELKAVTTEQAAMREIEHNGEILASSSSSSSSSSASSNSWPWFAVMGESAAGTGRSSSSANVRRCVRSWKMRKAPYADRTNHEPFLETESTSASGAAVHVRKMVGNANDMQEKRSIAMLRSALLVANFCSFSMTYLRWLD